MQNSAAFAVAAALLSIIAAAGLTPGGVFNYADASEAQQQRILDGVARGFTEDFNATSGAAAEVTHIDADAERDLISVDVRFAKKEVENVSGRTLIAFRDMMYAQNCSYLMSKKLIENGVRLNIRMIRPSGAALTNLSFNDKSCARFVDPA